MPKNPFFADKVILANGGTIETAGGTSIIEVSSAGVPDVVAGVSPGDLTLTDTQILVGNGSNVAAGVAMSGDATIANTGALTISALAIDFGMLSAALALDEDNMASDSATAICTQQSIKAYVDAQVATADTLQEVYDNGQSITIADTVNTSLTLNQNDTSNNPLAWVVNNAGTGVDATYTNTNAGATGVQISTHHDSASPSASDQLYILKMYGEDDGGTKVELGRIELNYNVTAAGAEESQLNFYIADGTGSLVTKGYFDKDNLVVVNKETVYHAATTSSIISDASTGTHTVQYGDAGAVGATYISDHASASPAISDVVFSFDNTGRDSGANTVVYARENVIILDPTSTTQTASYNIFTQNGANALGLNASFYWSAGQTYFDLGSGTATTNLKTTGGQNLVVGEVGSASITFGAAAAGNLDLASGATGSITTANIMTTSAQVGTSAANTTVVEEGNGAYHKTIITFTDIVVGTSTAGGNSAHGVLVYTFPAANVHLHSHTWMSAGLTVGTVTTDQPDVGIGSTQASGANDTLNSGTEEDYVTAITWTTALDGTAYVQNTIAATAGLMTGISNNAAGDVKTVYLNVADGWAAGVTGNLTASGTITLIWSHISA